MWVQNFSSEMMNTVLKRSHYFCGLVTRQAMTLVKASLKSGLALQNSQQYVCLTVLFLGREGFLSALYGTLGPCSRWVVLSCTTMETEGFWEHIPMKS